MKPQLLRTPDDVGPAPDSPPQLQPIQVANVLRRLQASAAPQRAISVTLEIDEVLRVEADETLLAWAIGTLLHNGIKFSRVGARVHLACQAEDYGVVIEVHDECGGLAPTETRRVCEQLGQGRARSEQVATGLVGPGLASTRRAVEAMGGRVAVANHPGQGCTFSLIFPHPVASRVVRALP